MDRFDDMHQFLSNEADALTSECRRSVIPVGRISFDLGAHIERGEIDRFKCYLILPQSRIDWARIILPLTFSRSQRVKNYERFCVAHELAHLLIHRNYYIIPKTTKQYWYHELLCDTFARNLLMPIQMLAAVSSGTDILDRVMTLGRNAQVPEMQAARRLQSVDSRFRFFMLSIGEKVKIESSSLHNNLARGRLLGGVLESRLRKLRVTNEEHKSIIFNRDQMRCVGLGGADIADLMQLHMRLVPGARDRALMAVEPYSEEAKKAGSGPILVKAPMFGQVTLAASP